MTPEQQRMVRAMNGCRFQPGSFAKRFTQDMFARISQMPPYELTQRQAETLVQVFHSYRNQHHACRCPECWDPTQQSMFDEEEASAQR